MKLENTFSTEMKKIKSGGVKLGELKVKCKRCQHIIGTGISMDLASFKSSSLSNNSVVCQNCRSRVFWNKEDVLDN